MGLRRVWRTPLWLAVILSLGGCKTWQSTAEDPRQVLVDHRPRAVRVTDQDGTTITVRRPVIRNDSIVTSETDAFGAPLQEPGIPYAEVNAMAFEQFSAARTGVMAAVIIGIAVGWTQVVGDSSGGNSEPNPPLPKGFSASLNEIFSAFSGLVR